MGEQEKENTDLIDVSDVAKKFELEATEEESRPVRMPQPEVEEPPAGGFMLASLKDRFAAAIIDGIFLYILYWFLLIAYRSVALGQAEGPIPASGWHGLIFHGIFLLIAFFYFFVFETLFYASIGKLACRLSIRDVTGNKASISGVFLRNLLRLVDLFLMPLAIGIIIMEKTGWHQRLGDFAGRTVVIRKLQARRRQYVLTLDTMASASGRLLAFLIDSIFSLTLGIGWALLLNPDQPIMSMILVVAAPVVFFLFYSLPEVFTKTSVGKLICGYEICHEDGSALDCGSAMTRTAARIFDMNFFGFLCVLFSIRKQRPGDLAAGTVVCRVPRQLKGLIGAIVAAAAVVAVFIAGLDNRNNFLSGPFKINFLPAIDFRMAGLAGLESKGIQNLSVQDFSFAAGTVDEKRKPSIFQPGEKVFLDFNVDGYDVQDGKAWIQEDLLVRYPDESIGLKLENVIDFHETLAKKGPIEFTNNIVLPDNALPGRYTVTLTIRDKNSGRQLKEQRFFYVTPPGGAPKMPEEQKPATPQPPPAQPQGPPAGPRTIVPTPS